jgi:FkbM family methyltransferase
MKPILIKSKSPLHHLLPFIHKTRRGAWKYFDRTGCRLMISGGRIQFLDVALTFPENVGLTYATSLFWNGPDVYEADTSRLIASLLGRVDSFIDVGSNIGIYAVYAGIRFPHLSVSAFEPIPEIWQKNVAFHHANNLPTDRVFNLACSDSNTSQRIFFPQPDHALEEEQTATLRPDSWQASSSNARCIDVKCITLDSFFSTRGWPAGACLLKIDVEDFEAAVLRGAQSFVSKCRPWILCEILPREHHNCETLALLAELKYMPFAVTSNGLFRMASPDFSRPRELKDFLLLPAEKIPSDVFYLPIESLRDIPMC